MRGVPRIVIIENDPAQAQPIIDALSKLGLPFVHYRGRAADCLPDKALEGVRILFLDFHLGGTDGTGAAMIESAAISHLRAVVGKDNGPWILFTWSSLWPASQLDVFREKMKRNGLSPAGVHILDNKAQLAADPAGLLAEITKALKALPSLYTLIEWEHAAADAAASTVNRVFALSDGVVEDVVDVKKRLSALARADLGEQSSKVSNAERAAGAMRVLNGVLADRIERQLPTGPEIGVEHIEDADGAYAAKVNECLLFAQCPAKPGPAAAKDEAPSPEAPGKVGGAVAASSATAVVAVPVQAVKSGLVVVDGGGAQPAEKRLARPAPSPRARVASAAAPREPTRAVPVAEPTAAFDERKVAEDQTPLRSSPGPAAGFTPSAPAAAPPAQPETVSSKASSGADPKATGILPNAVYDLPSDAVLLEMGLPKKDAIIESWGQFSSPNAAKFTAAKATFRPILLDITAICDHAQPKPGVRVVVAVLVEADFKKWANWPAYFVEFTPAFNFVSLPRAMKMLVDGSLLVSPRREFLSRLVPLCLLRVQLLAEIQQKVSAQISRPGTTFLSSS